MKYKNKNMKKEWHKPEIEVLENEETEFNSVGTITDGTTSAGTVS